MHPVERKLANEILPNTEAVRGLKGVYYYWLYHIYVYSHDLLASLAAVGIAPPVLKLFSGENIDYEQFSDILPIWMTLSGLILWTLMKIFISREDVEKKAILAKSCMRQFRAIEHEINNILTKSDPIPALNKLYDEKIQHILDRNIQEGLVEITDLSYSPRIQNNIDKKLEKLKQWHSLNWTNNNNPNIRQ